MRRETESVGEAIDFALSALRALVSVATQGAAAVSEEERKTIEKGGASSTPAGAQLAAMTLGVVMQAGLNKIYNRLPGPFSQHADTFTRTIMAILHQK